MIDNHLLEQFVTFAKYKTLSATAKELLLTQPTVTRGMQKLEEDLGVKLFNRQSNQISLNETGQFAVAEAEKVLQQNQEFINRVQNFDQSHREIKVASNAPGPVMVLQALAGEEENVNVNPDLLSPDEIVGDLTENRYSFIISNQEIQTDEIESLYIGKETLNVNLDQFMIQSQQPTITFDELKGLSFVVLSDIGPWKQVIQDNIPDAKFLYQTQWEALREITNYSSFPYFTTNITEKLGERRNADTNQIMVPISSPAATMDFYLNYQPNQRKLVRSLVDELHEIWAD